MTEVFSKLYVDLPLGASYIQNDCFLLYHEPTEDESPVTFVAVVFYLPYVMARIK